MDVEPKLDLLTLIAELVKHGDPINYGVSLKWHAQSSIHLFMQMMSCQVDQALVIDH
jgi:hypothetical protein